MHAASWWCYWEKKYFSWESLVLFQNDSFEMSWGDGITIGTVEWVSSIDMELPNEIRLLVHLAGKTFQLLDPNCIWSYKGLKCMQGKGPISTYDFDVFPSAYLVVLCHSFHKQMLGLYCLNQWSTVETFCMTFLLSLHVKNVLQAIDTKGMLIWA